MYLALSVAAVVQPCFKDAALPSTFAYLKGVTQALRLNSWVPVIKGIVAFGEESAFGHDSVEFCSNYFDGMAPKPRLQ
jgi:hypothetical protein